MSRPQQDEPSTERLLHALQPAQPRSEVFAAVERRMAEDPSPNAGGVVVPLSRRSMRLRDWMPLFKVAAVVTLLAGVTSVAIRPWKDSGETTVAGSAAGTKPDQPEATNSNPSPATGISRLVPDEGLHPVRGTPEMEALEDDGIVILRGDTPYRSFRLRLRDQYQWEEPEEGGKVRVQIPREERLLIPIETQ